MVSLFFFEALLHLPPIYLELTPLHYGLIAGGAALLILIIVLMVILNKKKRGPKKKKPSKKSRVKIYDGSWNYKILRFDFRKQVKYIGKYRTYPDAYSMKCKLLEENSKVEFPKTYINNRRKDESERETLYEYGIMKRIRGVNETNESELRNEYGKIVKHATTSERYYLYEKFPCLVEETFWVYGCHPKKDRKEFKWIREELVEKPYEEGGMLNIYMYNNKVIFRQGPEFFRFVICKNIYDARLMYRKLNERYSSKKMMIFSGAVSGYSERGKNTIKLISEITGWPLVKIYKTSTAK